MKHPRSWTSCLLSHCYSVQKPWKGFSLQCSQHFSQSLRNKVFLYIYVLYFILPDNHKGKDNISQRNVLHPRSKKKYLNPYISDFQNHKPSMLPLWLVKSAVYKLFQSDSYLIHHKSDTPPCFFSDGRFYWSLLGHTAQLMWKSRRNRLS